VRIHPRRGLVEQQEARLRDQRAGDLQPATVGVGRITRAIAPMTGPRKLPMPPTMNMVRIKKVS
jgi:hypothetical protein